MAQSHTAGTILKDRMNVVWDWQAVPEHSIWLRVQAGTQGLFLRRDTIQALQGPFCC